MPALETHDIIVAYRPFIFKTHNIFQINVPQQGVIVRNVSGGVGEFGVYLGQVRLAKESVRFLNR
jgi:hypothetical protein